MRYTYLKQTMALTLALSLTACDAPFIDSLIPDTPDTPSASTEPVDRPTPTAVPEPSASAPAVGPEQPGSGAPPQTVCGGEQVLNTLSASGIQVTGDYTVRLFETPYQVGSVLFNQRGEALVFSSEKEKAEIHQTDPCGGWALRYEDPVLKGQNGKNAYATGQGDTLMMALDFWPDGGNLDKGLFRLTPNAPAQRIPTQSTYDGQQDLMPVANSDLVIMSHLEGVQYPDNAKLQVLRSNYTLGPIGSLFYEQNGDLYLINSSPQRQNLVKIAFNGSATRVAEHDLLRSTPWKHGAVVNGAPVISIDFAPDTGNGARGIFQFTGNGEPLQWKTTQSHDGLHDMVADGQGGIYFADFENDGLWHMAGPNSPEQFVIDREHNVVPGALQSLAYDTEANLIYGVNWVHPEHWWANGGEKGVYKINPANGSTQLMAKAPEDSRYYGLTQGQGGVWGRDLYTIDEKTKAILRLHPDGTTTPVVQGLPNPVDLKIDPQTGTMTILCDRQFLVQIGTEFSGLKPAPASEDAGFYFTDFENDNLWLRRPDMDKEEGILDTEIPPGLFALAYAPAEQLIYGLNRSGGWPFGGEAGLYQIWPGGYAVKVNQPSSGAFEDLALATSGAFAPGFYLSESEGNQIVHRDASGQLLSFASGFETPGSLAFSPSGKQMLAVVNQGKALLWISGDSLPEPSTSPPAIGEEKTLFSIDNIAQVFNQPTSPSVFTLEESAQITFIQTYHWNNAQGKPGGTIGLEHEDGTLYGPWPVSTRDGQGGVPNAYWTATPMETLPAGTYTVVDSDPATWAQNSGSGGRGMVIIKGVPQ